MDKEFASAQQVNELGKMLMDAKGQILAMGMAIRTLLLIHSNREAAIDALGHEFLRWEAAGLNAEVPDAMLEGFQRGKGLVLPSDADLQRYP